MPAYYSTTDGTWGTWCTTTATATTGAGIWKTWIDCGTTSTTTSTVWTTWCTTDTTTCAHAAPYNSPPQTPEQIAARERASAEATARERKRIEAEARAEKLLLENLSLTQRLDYQKHRSFVVHGKADRRFRIRHGRSGNVDVIDRNGRIQHRLCAHPGVNVPNCDTMLAQKLLLEDDEDAFMRIANKHAAIDGGAPVLPALH